MRTEVRQKTVDYTVYIADDGKEFETEYDCLHHEKLINGEIIICPECNGEGQTSEWEEWDNYHTGVKERSLIFPPCKKCNGRGYLKKVIKETWE